MAKENGKTFWVISKLRVWDKNPRTISKENFERLKAQIEELGEYKPLIITPDGEVLGGNMRLRAFKELGYKKCWVSIVKPKNEAEKVKYALSDNDQLGDYHKDELANLLGNIPEIDLSNYTINLTSGIAIDDLLDQFKEVEEDEIPELSQEPLNSTRGEIYELGRHRVMCGDSTKSKDVEKLMDGKKADMVFTDPPYDIEANREKGKGFGGSGKGDYQMASFPEMEDWLPLAYKNMADNAGILVFENWRNTRKLWGKMEAAEFKIKNLIIWRTLNRHNLFSPGGFWNKYDICLAGAKGKFPIRKVVAHKTFDFIEWAVDSKWTTGQESVLGTKPLGILIPYIKSLTNKNGIVLDLFGGAGSTLIACEQLERICYMMEINPAFCDVIRKRYGNYKNKKA